MSSEESKAVPADASTAPVQGFLNQEAAPGLRKTVVGVYKTDSMQRRLDALNGLNLATAKFSSKEHTQTPGSSAIIVESTIDLEPSVLTQMREKARSAV